MKKSRDCAFEAKGLHGHPLEEKKGLRGQDLNLRPSGYEPDELPGCSTPRLGAYDSADLGLHLARESNEGVVSIIRAA